MELCIHIHCRTALQGLSTLGGGGPLTSLSKSLFFFFAGASAPWGGGYCHDPFLKLSPHSSELSLWHCMHLNPYFPSSTRDPDHPQPYPTMHQDPLPLHLGLVPRHSTDHNPLASGMQTPSGIMWSSCD